MKIYVASSWRNDNQPKIVEMLREEGHEVYDFKNPEPGDAGFHWSDIGPDWQEWTPEQLCDALDHPAADHGFSRDMIALMDCDVCALIMPCGRSAHLEAGYAIGAGKPLVILLSDGEPELMYKMTHLIATNEADFMGYIATLSRLIAKLGTLKSNNSHLLVIDGKVVHETVDPMQVVTEKELYNLNIINDPLETVIQAVKELYPCTQALIQFNPELKGEEYGECGCTIFPDDGGMPIIDISTNIPVWATIEILAHELAHVVAGPDVDVHGKEWQTVFNAIHQKYDELVELVEKDC